MTAYLLQSNFTKASELEPTYRRDMQILSEQEPDKLQQIKMQVEASLTMAQLL